MPGVPAAMEIVRFARRNILFYDVHVIDLYHRIRALYRGVKIQKQRKKPPSNPAIATSDHKKRRMRRFVLRAEFKKPCVGRALEWWAHQGSNLGPAD